MKTGIKNPLVHSVLITASGLMLTGRVTAQTFTTLHSFTAPSGPYGTNSDGQNPSASLMFSTNTLFGTTYNGGSSGQGTAFRINTDGTGFTNLHSFTLPAENANGQLTNSDGRNPSASLISADNTLYGTTSLGGGSSKGIVFKVNIDGTGFTNLHSFTTTPAFPGPYTNSDGANPTAGLILSGDTLYGTTESGGGSGRGTVFAINVNGSAFTNLYSFTGGIDGAGPQACLVLSGNILYGAASYGGSSDKGTVFSVTTNGTGFTNLHSFTALSGSSGSSNTDGANPIAGLILSGNTLFGTAEYGGSSGKGTAFRINTDGTGFTNLHNFTKDIYNGVTYTNGDGADLRTGLILSGNTLYGAASGGGLSGEGTLFRLNTDGSGFTNLHSYTMGNTTNGDGAHPTGLTLAGNTLYGTTGSGGNSGNGTVFGLSFPPKLTVIPSGAYVILTWPTNFAGFDYAGFTLQSTTNLVSSLWTTNSTAPVVVTGQNTVTNPISGAQEFYRLSQ